MTEIVYVRMKKKVEVENKKIIKLKHIAYLSSSLKDKERLEETTIYRITKADRNIIVIDCFLIIDYFNQKYKNIEFSIIGPTETIIRVKEAKKKQMILVTVFVWLLLFIGTAMTIINFHYDVSMQEVHQKLHYFITGKENDYPLWIQVPYSFGLGIGMLLFLNHWFKKRFNEEPSPLEIELFNYQQDLDHYVTYYENEFNDT